MKLRLAFLLVFAAGALARAADGDRLEALSAAAADGVFVGAATAMEKIQPRDGALPKPAKNIRVRLARGEREAVQIFVAPVRGPLAGAGVAATELVRSNRGLARLAPRKKFPASHVKTSVLGYVETVHEPPYKVSRQVRKPDGIGFRRIEEKPRLGWWPDPILGHLASVDVAVGDVQGFWVEFHAPDDQAAGVYEGELVVSAGGREIRRLPLEVRVNDFAVPKRTPIPTALSFAPSPNWQAANPDEIERNNRLLADPESPVNKWKRHEAEWIDFLADRFVTFDNLYQNSLANDSRKISAMSRFARDGRLVGFNLGHWDFPKRLDETGKAMWRVSTVARLLKSYQAAKSVGLERYVFIYGCDDVDEKHFENVRWAVNELKRVMPKVPILTTTYDDKFGVGTKLDVMDRFTPLTEKFDPGRAEKARKEGRQIWWHIHNDPDGKQANMYIESPAIEGRLLMGAMTAKYRPDGFLYQETTIWNSARPISGPSAFTDWMAQSWTSSNGGYSWLCAGPDGVPCTTVRFENFRDGLEDLAYVQLLEEKIKRSPQAAWADAARELAAVPKTVLSGLAEYTNNPDDVLAWRDAMADAIEKANAEQQR